MTRFAPTRLAPIAVALSLVVAACGAGSQAADPLPRSEAHTTAAPTTETPTTAAPTTDAPTTTAPDTSPTTEAAPNATFADPVETVPATPIKETTALGTGLLAKAVNPSPEEASARFEVILEFEGVTETDGPVDFSFEMSGGFDTLNDASELEVDFGPMFEAMAAADPDSSSEDLALMELFISEPLHMINVGDRSWIKWGFLSFLGVPEGKYLEGDADDASVTDDFAFTGPGSPTELLESLQDADAQVDELGTETIRGVATTHYRAIVGIETMTAGMSASELEQFEADLGASPVSDFPMDFWLDADGLIRRYSIDLSDPAFQLEDSDELQSASMTFEMWDYGADLGIQAPPADLIVTEDELTFGFEGLFED